MTELSDSERAERLSRKRAQALPVLAVIFVSQQAVFFARSLEGTRTGDVVHVSAWLILSVVMLLVLTTGGGWNQPRKVRELANDESTRAHRDRAFRVGFIASMAGCVLLYFMSIFEPISGREAIHLIMTIGIAAALLRFGNLERRALRDA